MTSTLQGLVTAAARVLLALIFLMSAAANKNLALMGAMLLIIANGAGPMSVDRRLATRETP